MRTPTDNGALIRHIGLGHGVALYVSAILGAGMLVLPGQVASLAGPASLLSWALACLMGVPLAWMFASLARTLPDAGGVSTYVGRAFGTTAGSVTGWTYFIAGSVGQTIVPLTGGYYVAQALRVGRVWAFVVAALILSAAVVGNLVGVKLGGRTQIVLAAAVASALVVTIAVAVPSMSTSRLHPFMPHGPASIGSGVIVLFFAFAGWEAIAHLVGEFRHPDRDVPRAVATTVAIVTVVYLGIAAAVVLTGTYGNEHIDHVSIGLVLQHAFGSSADTATALIATAISLATTNAFVAGVSRLGYSLAGAGWLPQSAGRISRTGVPTGGVATVALIAYGGLALSLVLGWGTETLVVVPSTLVVVVYLLAAAAGCRLLKGLGRVCAAITIVLTLLFVPAAAAHVLIPVVVIVLALVSRAVVARGQRKVRD